jgi:hypothetical protein
MLTTDKELELRKIAVTNPEAESTETLSGKVLLHVPPAGELVRVAVSLGHNATGTITDGNGLTVTVCVTKQVGFELERYVITAVPVLTPVTNPL